VIDPDLILEINLTADGGPSPEARDVAAFLTDLNLFYELKYVYESDEEAARRLENSPWALARYARQVPQEDRLRYAHLALGSPLEVQAVVPMLGIALGAALATVKAVTKIYNLPLERRNLRADAELKELEAERLRRELFPDQPSAFEITGDSALPRKLEGVVERRLQRSPIRVTRVSVGETLADNHHRH
jgi:hypothetical protein